MTAKNGTILFPRPNATTFTDFIVKYPNRELLEGTYGYMILMMVFTVAMGNLVLFTTPRKSFVASSFITLIAATLLVPLGIIPAQGWFFSVILLIAAALVVSRGGPR